MAEITLRECIESAYAGPGLIDAPLDQRRTAITALGVHCLFVKAGFIPLRPEEETTKPSFFQGLLHRFRNAGERSSLSSDAYRPPTNWLGLIQTSSEFIFRYIHPLKRNEFVVHCSLKPCTDQMYVRAREEGNVANAPVVGLIVSYTVPEDSTDSLNQTDSWDNVFGDTNRLVYNIETYLTVPLLRDAINEEKSDGWSLNLTLGTSWIAYSALIVLLSLLAHTLIQKRKQNTS